MAVRSRVASAVERLLSGACCVLEGGKAATLSIDKLIQTPTPEGLVALRLCGSDILVAYYVSGRTPETSLLQAIVGAIVALPKLPCWVRNASVVDRATLALLKRNGISGFACRANGREPKAPAPDPIRLIEWAAARRPLAIPNMLSLERRTVAARRAELFEGVALALLESNAALASAGLRWLAVQLPSTNDSVLISAGIRRATQLGADEPQIRFNCCLATKVLGSRKR